MESEIKLGQTFYRTLAEEGSSIEHLAFDKSVSAYWEVVTSFRNLKASEIKAYRYDNFQFCYYVTEGIPFFCFRPIKLLNNKGFGNLKVRITGGWQEMPFHLKLTFNQKMSEEALNKQYYEAEEGYHHTIRLFLIEHTTQTVRAIRFFTLAPKWWSKVCTSLLNNRNSITLLEYDKTLDSVFNNYKIGDIPEQQSDNEFHSISGE